MTNIVEAIKYPHNVLLVTLDSCRWDTFQQAKTPNMDRISLAERAQATANFTLPAHTSIFAGHLPRVIDGQERHYLSPGGIPLWRLDQSKLSTQRVGVYLRGNSIMEGYRKRGYLIRGFGGTSFFWNDKELLRSHFATSEFLHFGCRKYGIKDAREYPRDPFVLPFNNIEEIASSVQDADNWFLFINAHETHRPYNVRTVTDENLEDGLLHAREYRSGRIDQQNRHNYENLGRELHKLQIQALEFIDQQLGDLLEILPHSSPLVVVICGDHGEMFGERSTGGNGYPLWGHMMNEDAVLSVPLIIHENYIHGLTTAVSERMPTKHIGEAELQKIIKAHKKSPNTLLPQGVDGGDTGEAFWIEHLQHRYKIRDCSSKKKAKRIARWVRYLRRFPAVVDNINDFHGRIDSQLVLEYVDGQELGQVCDATRALKLGIAVARIHQLPIPKWAKSADLGGYLTKWEEHWEDFVDAYQDALPVERDMQLRLGNLIAQREYLGHLLLENCQSLQNSTSMTKRLQTRCVYGRNLSLHNVLITQGNILKFIDHEKWRVDLPLRELISPMSIWIADGQGNLIRSFKRGYSLAGGDMTVFKDQLVFGEIYHRVRRLSRRVRKNLDFNKDLRFCEEMLKSEWVPISKKLLSEY